VPPIANSDDVTIRLLQGAGDAAAFRALNEEWIERHFALEERDRRQLADPIGSYVEPGGAVLIAVVDGQAIGCVALAARAGGAYELSKMAVSPQARGRGVGRLLLAAAIDHARALGARSVFLGSSKKLPNAVHLYEAFGFEHVPREGLDLPSQRADVFMALELS
jgi:putative acetyltransferase